MQSILLQGTSLSVSRFVFGTGSLHHLGNLSDQVGHLQAAADEGFRHFDTAPLYGFGQAERALGLAFGLGSDTKVTVTTKVGIYPPGGAWQSRTAMLGRKFIGKFIPAFSKPVADWAVDSARASLDGSLRRLNRDHIDLLLLHEPDHCIVNTDEWLTWLQAERGNRVANFGICGSASRIGPFVETENSLTQVIQAPDSVERREADQFVSKGHLPQITYGYLSSNSGTENSEAVLRAALSRNRTGAIIVSTRRRARLKLFAELAAEK
jgi:aryl-alcohol dehydrogenase-like predicted oxidoreductase